MEKQPHQEYRDELADELKDMKKVGKKDLARDYLEYKQDTQEYTQMQELHRTEEKKLEELDSEELINIGKSIDTDEKWAEIIETGKISIRDLFDKVLIDIGTDPNRDWGKNTIQFNCFNVVRGKKILEAIRKTYTVDMDFSQCTSYELSRLDEWITQKDHAIYQTHISTIKNSTDESKKEEQRQADIRVIAKKLGI